MAEPTVPVRDMVDLIVDQWNRGLEAHEALRLLIPLTYRVLNVSPTPLTAPAKPYVFGAPETPYAPGDDFHTRAMGDIGDGRHWFVDQSGVPVEAKPDGMPPPLMQAWHGDDPAPGPLTPMQRTDNQHAATKALASGRITVEEVGAVVKGLHPASTHFAFPEVPGE